MVVRACTVSRWQGFSHGCAIDGTTWTDADGRFAFDEVERWGWLTVGEAPLPTTVVFTCADGGAESVPVEAGYAPELDAWEYLSRACR